MCNGGYAAYFGQGTKLTVLDPSVKITEPTVTILPPSPKEGKGKKKKKTLVCVASDFYPDHVTVSWQKNGEDIIDGVATDEKALQDKTTKKYSITSRLRVKIDDWSKDSNIYTCTVYFFNGTNTIPVSSKMKGNPEDADMESRAAAFYKKSTQIGKLTYIVLIAKSTFYGLVIIVLIWKLKGTSGKRCN